MCVMFLCDVCVLRVVHVLCVYVVRCAVFRVCVFVCSVWCVCCGCVVLCVCGCLLVLCGWFALFVLLLYRWSCALLVV